MELEKFWWHRLLKVLFLLATLTLAFFVFLLAYSDSPALTSGNTDVVLTLKNYTKNSKSSGNVVPEFIKTDGQLGCLNSDGSVSFVSSYELEKKVFCNAQLLSKAPAVASFFNEEVSAMKDLLEKTGDSDSVCLMRKSIECDTTAQIIKYKTNQKFVLHKVYYGLATAAWVTGVWVAIILLLYYKGAIYIVFGGHKNR